MLDLSLLMPQFADRLREFVVEANYIGLNVDVQSAFRSGAEQDRLYSLGRTIVNPDGKSLVKPMGNIVTNAKGGYSWHNWGVAADVVFRKNNNWDWNASGASYYQLSQVAMGYDLGWGGSWTGKGAALGDTDHFQFTHGLTIEEAVKLNDMNKVWAEILARYSKE